MTPLELVQLKQQAQQLSDSKPEQDSTQQLQRESLSASQQAVQGDQSGQQDHESQAAVAAQNSPGSGQAQAGASGGSPVPAPMQTDYLFHFGDTTEIRKALEMPNRLTG